MRSMLCNRLRDLGHDTAYRTTSTTRFLRSAFIGGSAFVVSVPGLEMKTCGGNLSRKYSKDTECLHPFPRVSHS